MTQKKFKKNIQELRENAVCWWPHFLADLASNESIIPKLLETQDKFLSLLTLADKHPFQIFELVESSDFPGNLFLKHLVVLADFGGEPIKRLSSNFDSIFTEEDDGYKFNFIWRDNEHSYQFKSLPSNSTLGNKKLHIDGKGLKEYQPLNDTKKDIAAILMFAALASDDRIAESENLSSCEVGTYLGKRAELEEYIKEKYIWVSRITGGAKSNNLGQVAQKYVVDYLKEKLSDEYNIKSNGKIQMDELEKPMPFDVLVEKGGKKFGIEISFQVTTNSTIERKSGQARGRYDLMHSNDYLIGYVIDGAGNFERSSAISKICEYSDCTVAYSDDEFNTLVKFIETNL